MKWIKSFRSYKESLVIDLSIQSVDVMESLNMLEDILLNSINAKEVDLYDTLKLTYDDFSDITDLNVLVNNTEFINSLSSISLKKSNLEDTSTYQTFLVNPCRFMFIYGKEQNELENPIYVILQVKRNNNWENIKLYKVEDDIKRFYDKLSSRVIEIVDGDENYIYSTSNGNDWELQNSLSVNDIYKSNFRKEELQALLDERKVKINII